MRAFLLAVRYIKHISNEEFECLSWLTVTYRFKQCVTSMIFKYFNEQCPNYLNEVFDVTTESDLKLRNGFQKLKCPFRKIHNGQYTLPYIGPTFWNQTPNRLKRNNNLDTFKHNLKKYFLKELKILTTLFKLIFNS